jgi:hypothetical protein
MVRRLIVRQRPPYPRPPGPPSLRAEGFSRFFDRLLLHGLEYFGVYYGTYRAIVVEDPQHRDNVDPQGRILVRVPAVGDTEDTRRLAYPIAHFAGEGYGFKTMPPVGGHCYVVFENGRVDVPLWFGGWWAQDDLPSELQPTEVQFWITPGGHQIILTDKDNAEEVLVQHSNGSALLKIDKDGNIFITNTQGKKVNIGDGADSANEPAVLGETLKGLLGETMDAINALTVPTPAGPSGTPVNAAQFASIKARLTQALSQTIQVK